MDPVSQAGSHKDRVEGEVKIYGFRDMWFNILWKTNKQTNTKPTNQPQNPPTFTKGREKGYPLAFIIKYIPPQIISNLNSVTQYE